jgi:hypothetical protein
MVLSVSPKFPPSIGQYFIFMVAVSKAVVGELLLVREVQVKTGNQVSESTHWGVDKIVWTCAQFVVETFKKVIP